MIEKQQEQIINPQRVKIAELENQVSHLKAIELNKIKYIKVLQAMIRSPKMCDLF